MNKSDYKGQVAVVTGAASGIGKGIAERCAEMGMKLSLGDFNSKALGEFEKELKAKGVEVITSVIDVTDLDQFKAFADKTIKHYGSVKLFFNNAGVTTVGNVLEMSMKDWRWVFDVNFFGVIHGLKAFVPFMKKQNMENGVIFTASAAAFLTSPNSPVYGASKHAVLALAEQLNVQLQKDNSASKAFVLCPGYVKTNLHLAVESRPEVTAIDTKVETYYESEEFKNRRKLLINSVQAGVTVDEVIDILFKGIEEDKFCILTSEAYIPKASGRTTDLVTGKRPTP
jgi:NADP-dependent 3-hydroxy acid dehydrogenase YdfG